MKAICFHNKPDLPHTFLLFHNRQFEGFRVRCLLSMQSITSHCQIANRFWQDTSEKHYSHHNREERSLCGVVLTKLTRPFTAFDTGLAASHNGRHIHLQMSSGKLKCQRFSQQHQGPARGIIDQFTFCLEPNIHPGGQKQEARQQMKEHLLQSAWCIHLFSLKNVFFSPHILRATQVLV